MLGERARLHGASKRMATEQQHEFLGVTPRRWIEYLAAVVLGNAIYYFSFVPHLPGPLRHQGFEMDWGVAIDFLTCVGVYGLIRLGSSL